MGGLIISPLPPVSVRGVTERRGPFGSAGVPPSTLFAGRSATLSPSADFPGSPVLRPTFSDAFAAGRGLLRPSTSLSCAVLPPRRSIRRVSRTAAVRAAFALRMGARPQGLLNFGATSAFTCVSARGLADHPEDDRVDGLQGIRFPSCLPSKLRGFDSYPGGTDSR